MSAALLLAASMHCGAAATAPTALVPDPAPGSSETTSTAQREDPMPWVGITTGGALAVGTLAAAPVWHAIFLQHLCQRAVACWEVSPGTPWPDDYTQSFAAYGGIVLAAGIAGGAAGGALDGDLGAGVLAGLLGGSIAASTATVAGIAGVTLGERQQLDAPGFYALAGTAAGLGVAGGAIAAHLLIHPVHASEVVE